METIDLKVPRNQSVLIGRTGKSVDVDLSKYPQDVLLRIWNYGHKRRYNDHQSGWTLEAYHKEIKKDGTEQEWHDFLMVTANGVRDTMYAGDWKEGGGVSLPKGVKEMRIHILATFKKRSVELKVKVSELTDLTQAEPFAARLVKAIVKRDKLTLDHDAAVKSVTDGWNTGVAADLAAAKEQGAVEIAGLDDVISTIEEPATTEPSLA